MGEGVGSTPGSGGAGRFRRVFLPFLPRGGPGLVFIAPPAKLDTEDESLLILAAFWADLDDQVTGERLLEESRSAAVPEDATPSPARSSRLWLNVYGAWPDPADDDRLTAWVRGFARDMEPFSTGGPYMNFLRP